MQLIRWRKQNGLSVRRAAELCAISAASISKIEHGKLWPSPDAIERIYLLTRAIGPEPVGAQDHHDAWRKINGGLLVTLRAAAAQSARDHRRLAGKPKKAKRAVVREESPDPPMAAGG